MVKKLSKRFFKLDLFNPRAFKVKINKFRLIGRRKGKDGFGFWLQPDLFDASVNFEVNFALKKLNLRILIIWVSFHPALSACQRQIFFRQNFPMMFLMPDYRKTERQRRHLYI